MLFEVLFCPERLPAFIMSADIWTLGDVDFEVLLEVCRATVKDLEAMRASSVVERLLRRAVDCVGCRSSGRRKGGICPGCIYCERWFIVLVEIWEGISSALG